MVALARDVGQVSASIWSAVKLPGTTVIGIGNFPDSLPEKFPHPLFPRRPEPLSGPILVSPRLPRPRMVPRPGVVPRFGHATIQIKDGFVVNWLRIREVFDSHWFGY